MAQRRTTQPAAEWVRLLGCSGHWLSDFGNARLWLARRISCLLPAVARRSTGTSAPLNPNGSIAVSAGEETPSKS
jgi:hypothetical protein